MTDLSVTSSVPQLPTAADSCPNMAAPLWRETQSQLITHTETDTRGGRREFSPWRVFVIGQAVQFVLVIAPRLGERERDRERERER